MTPNRLLTRWKRIAPRVHAHFRLSPAARRIALEDARAHPSRALRSYLAITCSLK